MTTERLHMMASGPGAHDVTETLLQLLEAAHVGRIRGVVFAVAVRGSDSFVCGSAGTLHRDPVKGLGASVMLQHELMALIPGRNVETIF